MVVTNRLVYEILAVIALIIAGISYYAGKGAGTATFFLFAAIPLSILARH